MDVMFVDMRVGGDDCQRVGNFCRSRYQALFLTGPNHVLEKVRDANPSIAIFDFSYPDVDGLEFLQTLKKHFPSVPVLMLTEYHSEALAVWSFRSGVWDYFVKPVELQKLEMQISSLLSFRNSDAKRENIKLLPSVPQEIRNGLDARFKTRLAVGFIENNYCEKISLDQLAEVCGMAPSQFSRVFKREHGVTFSQYLIQYRINKARELLKNPSLSFLVMFRKKA